MFSSIPDGAGLRRERVLWVMVAALVALAVWGPVVADMPHQHAFADQRVLWGVPCALDVLSNVPFALAGLWGLVALVRGRWQRWGHAVQVCAGLFFVGLVLTALGSGLYHWQPHDGGLLWDRLGMSVAFAGMLGLAAATRVSERAGVVLAAGALVLAPVAVAVWSVTGNVGPWVVVQLGGMALVGVLACMSLRPQAPPLRLALVLVCYALAKVLELQDHAVFAATHGVLAGHALKHVMAAGAALPVLWALYPRSARRVQNGASTARLLRQRAQVNVQNTF